MIGERSGLSSTGKPSVHGLMSQATKSAEALAAASWASVSGSGSPVHHGETRTSAATVPCFDSAPLGTMCRLARLMVEPRGRLVLVSPLKCRPSTAVLCSTRLVLCVPGPANPLVESSAAS